MKTLLVMALVGAGTAAAAQIPEPMLGHPVCYHQIRHIHCWFRGGEVDHDSDPELYFNNGQASTVFFDRKTHEFVTLTTNCRITCKPAAP